MTFIFHGTPADLSKIEFDEESQFNQERYFTDRYDLKLSDDVYFYRGGSGQQSEFCLSPEFGLCRRIVCSTCGSPYGYSITSLNAVQSRQVNEIALDVQKIPEGRRVVVKLPIDGKLSFFDPVTKTKGYDSPALISTKNLPKRRKFSIAQSDIKRILELESKDELIEVLEKYGIGSIEGRSILSLGASSFLDADEEYTNEEKILSICKLFRDAHYAVMGAVDPSFVGGSGGWPFANPSFPETSEDNWRDLDPNKTHDLLRAKNLLDNVAMGAKVYSISVEQISAIESNLVPLGKIGSMEVFSKVFQGKYPDGPNFTSIGGFKFSEGRVLFLNMDGEFPAGKYAVTYDGEESKAEAVTLCKSVNHSDYIKPEKQVGVGVLVSHPGLSGETIKDRIIRAIKSVYDPEIPVNVYDLGFIYSVDVQPISDGWKPKKDDWAYYKVKVAMTVGSPGCPMQREMSSWVKEAIENVGGVYEVDVELTFDPPWTMDMMTEDARVELGFM